MQTSGTVECDRDLELDGDLSEVLGLQTNVTVLKVKVKARVWISEANSNTAEAHHWNPLLSAQLILV